MVATREQAKADANKGEKYKARKIKSKIKTNTKLRLNPNPKYKYKSGPILSYVDLLNCHQDTVDFAEFLKDFFDNNENPSDKKVNHYCVSKEVLLEEFRLGFGRELM